MIKHYLNSQFKTRLLLSAVLVGLATLFTILYNYNFLVPVVTFAFLALIEVFFFHRKALIVTIITLLHLLLQSTFTYMVYETLNIYVLESLPLIITIMSVLGFLNTIIVVWWSATLSNGKMWATLTLALIAHYLGYFGAAVTVTASPILWPVGGLLAMLIVLVLRTIFPRKKKKNLTLKLPTTQQTSVLMETLNKKYNTATVTNVNFFTVEENKPFFYAITRYSFMCILPVDPQKSFTQGRNKLLLDGEDVTDMLEAYLNDIKQFSLDHKVPVKHITPVLYVRRNNHLGTDMAEVEVFPRHAPEKSLGSVFVVTPKGFSALLNRFKKNKKTLPKKVATVIKTFTNTTTK